MDDRLLVSEINFTTKAECNIVHMFSYHLVGGSTHLESSKLGRDLMIYAICNVSTYSNNDHSTWWWTNSVHMYL